MKRAYQFVTPWLSWTKTGDGLTKRLAGPTGSRLHRPLAPSNGLNPNARWATTRSETRLRGDCHRNTASSSIVRSDRAKFPSRD